MNKKEQIILDEAAEEWVFRNIHDCDVVGEHRCEESFIAGAEWHKEQMLKDAEECELYWDGDFLAIDLNMRELGYSEKDKVRIVILKEEC